ncbi:thermonuclease family protein [Pseudaestuariivita rosea]|uniref:thermonuclease family protein n=1 Tax=Pseudaestuariivita rosea TaxID=2763263 RepID=UPI001ABA748E|nr:hypothetical protein [Pseudaestuariivita rosea]
MKLTITLLLAVFLVVPTITSAETFRGIVSPYSDPATGDAEDLDSIRVNNQKIRLENIDNRNLTRRKARQALQTIEDQLGGKTATCIISNKGDNRWRGICKIGNTDIGEWMVRAGFARLER